MVAAPLLVLSLELSGSLKGFRSATSNRSSFGDGFKSSLNCVMCRRRHAQFLPNWANWNRQQLSSRRRWSIRYWAKRLSAE
jgi:hypothetical protein